MKYNVYLLKHKIQLLFHSTDRSRVELAARLLRLAGVSVEVKKAGGRGMWYVVATTDRLAAGREELRRAIAEIVEAAAERRWVDGERAGRLRQADTGGLQEGGGEDGGAA